VCRSAINRISQLFAHPLSIINSSHLNPFASIIGQSHAIEFLTRALAADRLPHGLLFAGPRGVGKRSTALALASIFLSKDPADATDVQRTHKHVHANTHADFHLVTRDLARMHDKTGKSKAVDFSISVVRHEIVEPASKKSVLGVGKVFLAREVETMNAQAQNALLKTLEEPSGRTLIVLCTDSPGAMLSTIKSRCQVVTFKPLSSADCLAIVKKSLPTIDDRSIKFACQLAENSPGLAIDFVQRGLLNTADQLFRLIDTGQAGELQTFLKASTDDYAKREAERDEFASEDNAKRTALQLLLKLASDHVRNKIDNSDALVHCDRIDAIARAEKYLDMQVNVSLLLQQFSAAVTTRGA
jgi:DNA polymerase III subunit delta'